MRPFERLSLLGINSLQDPSTRCSPATGKLVRPDSTVVGKLRLTGFAHSVVASRTAHDESRDPAEKRAAFPMDNGQILTVADLQGMQVSDLVADRCTGRWH